MRAALRWDFRALNRFSIRVGIEFWQFLAVDVGIFVAPAREVDDVDLAWGRWRALEDFGDSVRGFERRNDAFGAGQQHRGGESFRVAGGSVFGAIPFIE